MPDLFHLPDNAQNQQWFTTPGYQTWVKPPGISMVWLLDVAAGGGGGGGCSGATSTQRGGGGGGATGSYSTLLIPAFILPDELFMLIGTGGKGGAPDTPGSNAVLNNYVAVASPTPGNAQQPSLMAGTLNAALGGGAGTASIGGVAGSQSGVPPIDKGFVATWGIYQGTLGGVSSSGGVSGTPSTINTSNTTMMYGATGGAGCTSGNVDSPGGGRGATGFVPWLTAAAGGAAGGGNGQGGYRNRAPLFIVSGFGGGSNSAGTGGKGGDGVFGGGGGGGGGGITGGQGGDGGHGLVVVVCW